MSLIAYIQKDYHRWKIDKIAIFLANKEKKRIEDFKVKVILQDNFSFKDLFDKKRYKYFVGCNVDDLNFQLLFKFLKYEKFYTFERKVILIVIVDCIREQFWQSFYKV